MPGHHLTLDLGTARPEPDIEQYWDVPQPAKPNRELRPNAMDRRDAPPSGRDGSDAADE